MLNKTCLPIGVAMAALFAPAANATIVQFQTVLGPFEVNLYDQSTPATVANFLAYVNAGAYNNAVVHRAVNGFVVQGGGFTYQGSETLASVVQNAPVANEQIQREYKYLMSDKHMLESEPMTTTGLFEESDPLGAAFYPVDGGGRFATLEVPMENYTSFQSTVYFPRPKAGFQGILSLTLKNPRITPPITVRFKIPVEKGKKPGEAKKPAQK